MLALWSSSDEATIGELIANLSQFEESNVAKSLIALRTRKTKRLPAALTDLTFKLSDSISKAFSIKADRPQEVAQKAEAKLTQSIADCVNALKSFQGSSCSSARTAGVEVLRRYRALRPLVLRRESAFIGIAEGLLGGGFREFTLSYERDDMQRVIRQLNDVRRHATEARALDTGQNSVLWNMLIKPICDQLNVLVEEANKTSRGAITPSLSLKSSIYKADLRSESTFVPITARLVNKGVGTAINVVVNEPSIVAINKNSEVEAVGREAKEMLGRTPGHIVAIRPLKEGGIANFKVTEKMLNYFIQKAHNREMLMHIRIVIGVPAEITQVERRAVMDSAYRAKASRDVEVGSVAEEGNPDTFLLLVTIDTQNPRPSVTQTHCWAMRP